MTGMLDTHGVEVRGASFPRSDDILTPAALDFIRRLEQRFGPRRRELLAARVTRQRRFDAGEKPDFLAATKSVREGEWRVAPVPDDLLDRAVEITGPVDRKMIINALNSGARVFMADFEDSSSPTWRNMVEGQINLHDAIRRQVDFTHTNGKRYELQEEVATLMVRPRGWHLDEKHVLLHGNRMSASLFDFGLYFFHNAQELLARGAGPYFYLPKLESHEEARLWNDVFVFAQSELGIPTGTIKATVLIETITAAFEMDEILHELREHSAGLNCGRWDYIFSFIKKFCRDSSFVLPDRAVVTMTTHFLRSYSQLLIRTCHRRGAHAMGGMAAQIPIKNDPERNEAAIAKVRADKLREVQDGHDGTWVAHPGLIPVAAEVFAEHMTGPHQIDRPVTGDSPTAADLLAVPDGAITEAGLRTNLRVGIEYLTAWLDGVGCVPLHHLMEDAATAEISRAQVWQWVRHAASLDDGRVITAELVQAFLQEELSALHASHPSSETNDATEETSMSGTLTQAAKLFEALLTGDEFAEFITLPAYEQL